MSHILQRLDRRLSKQRRKHISRHKQRAGAARITVVPMSEPAGYEAQYSGTSPQTDRPYALRAPDDLNPTRRFKRLSSSADDPEHSVQISMLDSDLSGHLEASSLAKSSPLARIQMRSHCYFPQPLTGSLPTNRDQLSGWHP